VGEQRAVRRIERASGWVILFALVAGGAAAQAPSPPELPPGAVVRRIVMRDAASAEAFRARLEQFKSSGLFRIVRLGPDGKTPVNRDIVFLTSGNLLLAAGDPAQVDGNIETIRLMAHLFERPRAHLQMNLRVVQITGPANADVIQMAEGVRALVQAQRDEIVRTFADLEAVLRRRVQQTSLPTAQLVAEARPLMPTLGDPTRPYTVPQMLLLLLLDRVASRGTEATGLFPLPAADQEAERARDALLGLPQVVRQLGRDPNLELVASGELVLNALNEWRLRVTEIRDRFRQLASVAERTNDAGVAHVREALASPTSGIPDWLALRVARSLETTERVFPQLAREHAVKALRAMSERFDAAARRAESLASELGSALNSARTATPAARRTAENRVSQLHLEIQALADSMVPPPLAVYEMVAAAVDAMAPEPDQVRSLLREFTQERRRLELALSGGATDGAPNYARLQAIEATLNLWLRRVSEAMARALETHFYSRYANELRLLADRRLGRTSEREILSTVSLDSVTDVARDFVLAGNGVNVFVSNGLSLQFSPDVQNSVSAQVQAALPAQQSLQERINQASGALGPLQRLQEAVGVDAAELIKSLLAGGQPVPVRNGIQFAATPSIGFDAGMVTLQLSANQTLESTGTPVADRVTQHSISNATISALSYEPMVLSTLTSVVNYYEERGGIPVIRKTPIVRDLVNDLPIPGVRTERRARGVYQSSVIILEPVVIPTIEDLVRYHGGWTPEGDPNSLLLRAGMNGAAAAPAAP